MKIHKFIKQNWKFFIKYVIVGASGTLIDVGGFTALIRYTSLNRFIAATFSFIAAVINNFTWNKIWTFHDHDKNVTKQFSKFFLVSIGGLALNLFFLWFFALIIALFLGMASQDLPVYANSLAKLGASGAVLTYNFLMNRFWTFRHAVEQQQQEEES